MTTKKHFPIFLMTATVFAIVLSQANTVKAQSILNIQVGDTPSKLSKFGPVAGEDKYKNTDVFKWVFHNGNALTAWVDAEGEIVSLESDWGGKDSDTSCDLPGLKFGVTTLEDLRKRFGSNGFAFKRRAHVRQTDDGVVLVNTYEAGDVVVTFFTRINSKDYARLQAEGGKASGAEYARLEGISLANGAYARGEWGDKVADSEYKKIEWK